MLEGLPCHQFAEACLIVNIFGHAINTALVLMVFGLYHWGTFIVYHHFANYKIILTIMYSGANSFALSLPLIINFQQLFFEFFLKNEWKSLNFFILYIIYNRESSVSIAKHCKSLKHIFKQISHVSYFRSKHTVKFKHGLFFFLFQFRLLI